MCVSVTIHLSFIPGSGSTDLAGNYWWWECKQRLAVRWSVSDGGVSFSCPSCPCPLESAARTRTGSGRSWPRGDTRTASAEIGRFHTIFDTTYVISSTSRDFPWSTECWKIIPVKFQELSLNFPKLADWLSMGRPSCLAALRREISNMQE